MAYKFICSNDPAHLFEEPTFDYWCDKCPIEKRSMLVSYIDKETPKEEKVVTKLEEIKPTEPQEQKKNENKKTNKNEDKSKITVEPKVIIPVISIGEQAWMKENLKTDVFLNNEKIFHAVTEKEWIEAGAKKIPAWCYPDNDASLEKNYGKLYNWYAVSDPRGICPTEMRIPGKNDIKQLIHFLNTIGENAKYIKSKSMWKGNGNGEDKYDLNVSPYPKRYAMGTFAPQGFTSAYWTIDQHIHYTANYWELRSNEHEIKLGHIEKNAGFLIRCLKK